MRLQLLQCVVCISLGYLLMMKIFIHGCSNSYNKKNNCLTTTRRALLFFVLSLSLSNVQAITLSEAENIALLADPLVERFEATARSFEEESVAANTLPDPKLRVGAINVPVDSFDFRQEQMTQMKVGIQQSFPAGDTLELQQQRSQSLSRASLSMADDTRLQVLRDVREAFFNLYYELAAHQIINETRKLFSDLVTITESIYAAGRVSQQDVVLANLELSRLDDRTTKIQANEEGYRATLAQWIGEIAWGDIHKAFPSLPDLPATVDLNQVIPRHPMILSESAKIEASKRATDVARQDYKPGWSATLDYGFRSGSNPDGSSRPDFATALVSLDIPLFTDDRQDRTVASNEQKTAAARHSKDDKLRILKRFYEKNEALWLRLGERELIYKNNLLKSARNNSVTALTAYQSGVSEFNTLMRAEITELDVRLEDLRVRVDRVIAQSKLLYITGDAQ